MPDGSRAPIDITAATGLSPDLRDGWDALANPPDRPYNPFVSFDFLYALEQSGSVGGGTGWTPFHILARQGGALVGALPLYAKSHSYGEYVFDHSWADALHRSGGRYYPKLQCAAPFTPVTGPRLLASTPELRLLLARAATELADEIGASSVHVTFQPENEIEALSRAGYLPRTGVQFHWTNEGYESFEDFLRALSSQKRKNIRKEREKAQAGLTLSCLRGDELTRRHWDFFFRCYMDTGARKWGSPYLNRGFFDRLGATMGDRCVLFWAERDGEPIASALNLVGSDTLYGRYWGCVANVPFLHFELCYYQAIDFAIAHGLQRVEAGAQGEHKLLRGYAPATTHSAHWIAHPGLRNAVAAYLEQERPAIADEIEELAGHTPFRKES